MSDNNFIDRVSVVIPCRNEIDYISTCIDSILNQTYPINKIEILVIDGCSTDGTQEAIKKHTKSNPNVKMIANKKKIAPVAMNLGIKSASGDVIIIFGAHAYMDKNYIKKCVEKLNEYKDADCVGGRIINISQNTTSEAISFAMSSPFGVGNALFRYAATERYVDTVAFGAYRKEVFSRIGYFDEEFVRNQDDEFNFRLTQSGGKILLSPEIISSYYTRGSYGKLWKQYYQYGFWKVRVIQKHKRPASLRHLIPPTFVLGLILGGIGSIFNNILRNIYLFVIMIYLISAAFFTFKATKKNKIEYFYKVLYSFIILHISYGLGFMDGFLTFYILKNSSRIKKNQELSR